MTELSLCPSSARLKAAAFGQGMFSKFRIRCGFLHYLGIIIGIIGLIIIIFALFDPQFSYRLVTPGEDGAD